jgi:hypothetical protein
MNAKPLWRVPHSLAQDQHVTNRVNEESHLSEVLERESWFRLGSSRVLLRLLWSERPDSDDPRLLAKPIGQAVDRRALAIGYQRGIAGGGTHVGVA